MNKVAQLQNQCTLVTQIHHLQAGPPRLNLPISKSLSLLNPLFNRSLLLTHPASSQPLSASSKAQPTSPPSSTIIVIHQNPCSHPDSRQPLLKHQSHNHHPHHHQQQLTSHPPRVQPADRPCLTWKRELIMKGQLKIGTKYMRTEMSLFVEYIQNEIHKIREQPLMCPHLP